MALNTSGYSANLRQGPIQFAEINPVPDVGEILGEFDKAREASRKRRFVTRNQAEMDKLDDMVLKGKITKQEADDAKAILDKAVSEKDLEILPVKKEAEKVQFEADILTKPLLAQQTANEAQLDIDQKDLIFDMKKNARQNQSVLAQRSALEEEGKINRIAKTEEAADLAADEAILSGRKGIMSTQGELDLFPTVQGNKAAAARSTAAKYAAIEAAGGTLRTETPQGFLIESINPRTGEIEQKEVTRKLPAGAIGNNPKYIQAQEEVLQEGQNYVANIDRAVALINGTALGPDGKPVGKAQTGYFADKLPTLRAASQELEGIAAKLGIDATKALKGAISVRELELARSSTLSPKNSEEVNLAVLAKLRKIAEVANERAALRIQIASTEEGQKMQQAQLTQAVFDAIPDTAGEVQDPFAKSTPGAPAAPAAGSTRQAVNAADYLK